MKKFSVIVLGIFLFAACTNKTAPTQTNPVNASLEDVHWKLNVLLGFPAVLPADDKEIFLVMEDGKISGFAGCNNYFGNYRSRNETVRFSEIGSTKMYCEKQMEVESAFLDALSKADNFIISGMLLELYKGKDLLARFEAITR